jgi:hypothetical protein
MALGKIKRRGETYWVGLGKARQSSQNRQDGSLY